jgi:hypothetical protein
LTQSKDHRTTSVSEGKIFRFLKELPRIAFCADEDGQRLVRTMERWCERNLDALSTKFGLARDEIPYFAVPPAPEAIIIRKQIKIFELCSGSGQLALKKKYVTPTKSFEK